MVDEENLLQNLLQIKLEAIQTISSNPDEKIRCYDLAEAQNYNNNNADEFVSL